MKTIKCARSIIKESQLAKLLELPADTRFWQVEPIDGERLELLMANVGEDMPESFNIDQVPLTPLDDLQMKARE